MTSRLGSLCPSVHTHTCMCVVTQSCPALFDPMNCSPPGFSIHGIPQARILEWVAMLPPGGSSHPGIKPRSPALQADSLPSEPPGKPMNTGEGSLSLLQGIFLTQGSNPGLPHCRWILYHLSHQGSPWILEWVAYPFSRGSSRPRNQTGVSSITDGFFTRWATREAPPLHTWLYEAGCGVYKPCFFFAYSSTLGFENCGYERKPAKLEEEKALTPSHVLPTGFMSVCHALGQPPSHPSSLGRSSSVP